MPPPEPPPEWIVGRYELLEELGRGGMGAVWRARDHRLHRDVAIKEIHLPAGLGAEQAWRIHERAGREARSGAMPDHPNIVTVYDVVEHGGRPWIVMRLVRAPALDTHINRQGRPLPPAHVARIGLDVLSALRHAHANGIVHRDVKPGNVLLGQDGAVLTDFGIALIEGDDKLTQTGVIVGSPAYLSPEQARYERATAASDLWSLGATLYAAVEGRPPYRREDTHAMMRALLKDDPDPAELAGPLRPVLDGLLKRDPEQRMTADEAERALREVARQEAVPEPVFVPPTPPGGSLMEPPKDLSVDDLPLPGPSTLPPPGGAATRPPPGPARRVPWPLIIPAAVFGALLLVAAVVMVVFLNNNGGPGREGNGNHPPTTGAASQPGGTTSRPGGTASSAPVPSGYTLYDGSDFSAAYPTGWKVDESGGSVTFQDPAAGVVRGMSAFKAPGVFISIPVTLSQVAGAMSKSSEYRTYHEVGRRNSMTVGGREAGELEFTFTRSKSGKDVQGRAKVRIFEVGGGAEAVMIAASVKDWDGGQGAYEEFSKSFRTK